jgi:alkyl hydroperoxide reductase subunit AhpC
MLSASRTVRILRAGRAFSSAHHDAPRSVGGAIVRRQAPNFSADAVMPDGAFGKISLDDLKGEYAVLLWYPLDFTFVCPTEITAFSDRASEFKKIGCKIIGVSTDSKFSHLAWTNLPRNKGGLGKIEIPLIGDISKVMSLDYGMVVNDSHDDMDGLALRGVSFYNV